MHQTIREILAKMESLNNDLREEYDRLAKKYGFSLQKRRVIFLEEFRKRNKSFKFPTWRYAIPTNIRHFLSIPFIYAMIVPTLLLDIFLTIYQWTAFSLYHIPRVKRKDYIVYDRRFLDYLNLIQKINCLYCSYVNGVFAYAVEIGARTERYWCPVKAANKPKFSHGWYRDFADYGNPEEWNEKFNHNEEVFIHASEEKCFVKE
ncbi:MAG: hypothetical protein PHY14_02730 [Candidatus Gracilibacteria bacterium]|nr:hypothetical protein [Candidatus Gracilibacteria bacterium]